MLRFSLYINIQWAPCLIFINTLFSESPETVITPLGRAMSCFPVAPRYGKMLCLGHQHSLLPYVVIVVAALSVQELFVESDISATAADQEV